LQALLSDAQVKGAKVIPLLDETSDASLHKLAPYVILQTTDSMQIMQEEIFGPLLPVLTYRTLDEVIAFINDREHPLALYYFGTNQNDIDKILKETLSGGVTLNDTILHVGQDDLPFGGVGASGMGHYHGKAGFDTFSKTKGVFKVGRWSTLPLLYPPFTRKTDWILKWMLRLS
jgi:acyl-CoA reductase-like NAD-dependent aldehyde dehydrogenase